VFSELFNSTSNFGKPKKGIPVEIDFLKVGNISKISKFPGDHEYGLVFTILVFKICIYRHNVEEQSKSNKLRQITNWNAHKRT
jgi:hypothetical protein